MAFKTPKSWVTGDIVTAPQLNEEIRDQLNSIWVGQQAGDLEYYTSGSTKQRIPVGTNGYILKVVNGVPAWTSTSMIGCRISTTSYQNINANTETAVTPYATEDYDSSGFHSGTNGYFTIPAGLAGWYLIGAGGYFTEDLYNDRSRILGIKVANSYVVRQMTTQDTNSDENNTDVHLNVTTMAYCAVGNQIQAYVMQKSPSTLHWNYYNLWMMKVS